jgi:hypothetical protein
MLTNNILIMTNHTNKNRTLTIKFLNALQIKARSVQDQHASLLVTYKTRLEHTPLKSTVQTPDKCHRHIVLEDNNLIPWRVCLRRRHDVTNTLIGLLIAWQFSALFVSMSNHNLEVWDFVIKVSLVKKRWRLCINIWYKYRKIYGIIIWHLKWSM